MAGRRHRPEDGWHPARLIPTTGIGGQDEQEQRATSSLLAVMHAVPQFGRALLAHLDAPGGRISTYTEVRFADDTEKTLIPDGAVVVERGKTRWVCLVEVKTGGAPLRADQVEKYLDIARANGFDAVLTISNQLVASPSESPVMLDARKTRRVTLRHLSWWRVMTEARIQHEHRGIADTDQAWILAELIAYLDHPKAGAGGFEDMGPSWVPVRDAARQHALRLSDKGAGDVAARWEQLTQFVALGLCQTLGRDVEAIWPRKLDPAARLDQRVKTLVETGRLEAAIKVPDAVGPIQLTADLQTRLFTTSLELAAPREGRPKTRINWLLRQLKDAPETLRIEVRYPNVKESVSAGLKEAIERPERLLYGADPHREPKVFRLLMARELGTKRGRLAGSFVAESRKQVIDFYRTIVQGLRAWSASAPKLPSEPGDESPGGSTGSAVLTYETREPEDSQQNDEQEGEGYQPNEPGVAG